MYIASCEYGLCQALTNPNGWVVPPKANQEPITYKPIFNPAYDYTGTLADFDTMDPTLKLLEDLVRKAHVEGYSPNVILVGDAVAMRILQSP